MFIRPLVALSALVLAGTAVAVEDKWEVTTSMEMTGMPFQMPPTTQTICIPPGTASDKMIPTQDNCKVSNFKVTGATSRFHVECPAPQKMSGDGEVTSTGKDAYRGSMKARGNFDGMDVDMKVTYAGRKIGTCGAADNAFSPAAIMQQQQATSNMMCGQMVETMAWQMAPTLAPLCPDLQTGICTLAKKKFAVAATSSAALLALQEERRDWKELAAYCSVDVTAMTKTACTAAKRARNWNDAILICGEDAELEAAAKKECVGMKLTGNPQAVALRPLCEHYADKLPKPAAAAANPASILQNVDGAVNTGNSAIDTGVRAVEGYKKLKGLFGR